MAAARPPRFVGRREEWIDAEVFSKLEQFCPDGYQKMIGLDLESLVVDGCIVKAPYGGEATGPSPADRGEQGTKRSLLVDGGGIPVDVVVAPANRDDSPLLAPRLENLSRFGLGLPEKITGHLDAGYDSGKTRELLTGLGCDFVISTKAPRYKPEPAGSWNARTMVGPGRCRAWARSLATRQSRSQDVGCAGSDRCGRGACRAGPV